MLQKNKDASFTGIKLKPKNFLTGKSNNFIPVKEASNTAENTLLQFKTSNHFFTST